MNAKHKGFKFDCKDCDYTVSHRSNLYTHIENKGIKYSCEQCDFKSTQQSVIRHLKSKHEGIKS